MILREALFLCLYHEVENYFHHLDGDSGISNKSYDAGRDEENQHEDQNTEDLLLIGRAYLISNNVADLLSQTGQHIS